ncbi:MAG: MXAN_6577-like cysteine-rich protein [Polyangiales bacterium]
MTRMRWLALACALAVGVGCSTGEPLPADDAGFFKDDVVFEQDTGFEFDSGPRCQDPLAECEGTCVDLQANPNHCGVCGNACTAGQSCVSGACSAMMRGCADGETDCGGLCVNTTNDAQNCGACGSACGAGQSCVGGACMAPATCPSGQTDCGGACVDTNSDNQNCGRCGGVCGAGEACNSGACMATTTCPGGQTACAGVCVDTATDVGNCGACGAACMAGESCASGSCRAAGCPGGQTSCGGVCANTATDTANCGACGRACGAGQTCSAGTCAGATTCAAPLTRCGDACTDTNTDLANCGRCANACPSGQVCRAGACLTDMTACPTGQTSCGGACVDTNTSGAHCGGCGNACPTGQTCRSGACACSGSGQTLCGRSCVNTQTDASNCGACGNACATGSTCAAGVCQRTCPTGQTSCGGACVNTQTDASNCGACGNACAMGQSCSSGRCGCPTGETSCTTGMVTACVNLQTNASNCGRCGTACASGQRCTAGACACPTGTSVCSGRCVNFQTDANNCGRCGNVCPMGQTCSAAVCRSTTAPANDQRAGATTISLTSPSQTLTANTANARHDTDGACGCTGGSSQDVFYRFTLTQPEFVYADTFGTTWDTSLFIQSSTGANVTASGAGQVACNDDVNSAGFCTVGGLQSQIALRLAAGTYYLVVSGCGNGTATVHFQHLPAGNGTSARLGATATASTVRGTTSGTGTSTAPNCGCSGGPENGYFWVTCPNSTATPFYASSCGGATWDTVLDQRSAARGTSVSACNDDTGFTCGTRSTLVSTIPAGAGLHSLLVDGCGSSGAGAYTVTVAAGACASGQTRCATCVDTQTDAANCGGCNRQCAAGQFCRAGACTAAPSNDTVSGATTINLAAASQLLSVDTTNARHDVNGSCTCTGSTTNRDVFFRFTLTAPEMVYADTIGASWDTALALLTSTGGNISSAGITNGATCNDDGGLSGCATGLQSQVMAYLNPGTYLLMVSGCGFGTASVRFQHLPVGNDAPVLLTAATNRTLAGTTSGTGRVTGTSCPSTSPEDTYVWYTCQGAAASTFTASTCGRATWDTILAQHSAGRSTVRTCADDTCGSGLQSSLTSSIPAGPGLHALYVDGYNGASGAYTFLYTRR